MGCKQALTKSLAQALEGKLGDLRRFWLHQYSGLGHVCGALDEIVQKGYGHGLVDLSAGRALRTDGPELDFGFGFGFGDVEGYPCHPSRVESFGGRCLAATSRAI
ncbi:UDP-N-acetylmuramoylalanine-D-glutamate ligase [Serpentinimonas raichei]|uniref:UDP-N-acetylmuramoylalanine-D-glutamate ligase n=1 Tax=Serpentinimonas raichei TaxID=1458425 RepID=A0A060NQZ6_9BURK|nr:UDP-N-acetylmuramoylalanine-D-glutamate ligase [Serpentinimonas raichei]